MSPELLYERTTAERLLDVPVVGFYLVLALLATLVAATAGWVIGLPLGLWVRAGGPPPVSVVAAAVGGVGAGVVAVLLFRRPMRWLADRIAAPVAFEGRLTRKHESVYSSIRASRQVTRMLLFGETRFDVGPRAFDRVREGMDLRLRYERWGRRVLQIEGLTREGE